jgi:hypothetical protein
MSTCTSSELVFHNSAERDALLEALRRTTPNERTAAVADPPSWRTAGQKALRQRPAPRSQGAHHATEKKATNKTARSGCQGRLKSGPLTPVEKWTTPV